MQEKAITLINKGMNRDLSVSNTNEFPVYENHNIRITARDHDTFLSVTNERGNKEVDLSSMIKGTLLGWNVLNHHIILFTRYENDDISYDCIYRIDYDSVNKTFNFVGNRGPDKNCLYSGQLNFSISNPIESVVYFETEAIQKIYWVDGENVLRFLNFMTPDNYPEEYETWDDTSFDSNRVADFGVSVKITKDNSGNTRANGIVQYLITYFNKHGQETGYVWLSDIVYLSPKDKGGSADGTNNNSIILSISNIDTSFSHFRVYSIFRSTLDGDTVAYLVAEHKTSSGTITVIDDGAHLTTQDSTRLLYLGSQAVKAGTIEHKDQTLFLGDLKSIGRGDNSALEEVLRLNMFGRPKYDEKKRIVVTPAPFNDGDTYFSSKIDFVYSNDNDYGTKDIADIPLPKNEGNYPYMNQLQLTSSEILSFKGGEKYRFALKFKCADGTETDAFWIGDAINDKYPIVDKTNNVVKRVVARCRLPRELVSFLQESPMNYKTVQLLIAEATYADRSIKAQGMVNPTMFNVWERYNRRTYSIPSWITRIRKSNTAWQHFAPVKNSTSSVGEIQCNYWESSEDKTPYYRYKNYQTVPEYSEEFEGRTRFNDIMIIYHIKYYSNFIEYVYKADVTVVKGILYNASEAELRGYEFILDDYTSSKPYDSNTADEDKSGWNFIEKKDGSGNLKYTFEFKSFSRTNGVVLNHGAARGKLYTRIFNHLTQDIGIPQHYIVSRKQFLDWCQDVHNMPVNYRFGYYNDQFPLIKSNSFLEALNVSDHSQNRWQSEGDHYPGASYGDETPAFFKKHLMFIDENVVTVDSPELAYNAVSFDNAQYDFRIIGIAKQSSVISDYTIDATNSAVAGTNYDDETFSGNSSVRGNMLDGIISWPLWKDYGLTLTDEAHSREKNSTLDEEDRIKKRYSSDYTQGKNIVRYWMYLWQHSGSISGYIADESNENENKSLLKTKTFANLYGEFYTTYFNLPYNYDTIDSMRQVQEYSNSEILLNIGSEQRYYTANPKFSLSMPAELKYPLLYSSMRPTQTANVLNSSDMPYLYSTAPVLLEYNTQGHAVVTLHTDDSREDKYIQDVLPVMLEDEKQNYPEGKVSDNITGALIPWIYDKNRYNYAVVGFDVPVFTETVYSEENSTVSLILNYSEEPSLHRHDPPFYTVWETLIDFFGGEEVYTLVYSENYKYFVKINDVERTQSVEGDPMFSIRLDEAYCVARIARNSSENPTVLANVRIGYVTNMQEDAPAKVDVSNYGSAQLNLRSGALIHRSYPYRDYKINQPDLTSGITSNSGASLGLTKSDRYFFIGEIYKDFGIGATDTRYGGIYLSDVETNRFIAAGPQYLISEMNSKSINEIYGNQGDTYFQRWDALRVKPYSKDAVNKVIDITSFMVETHINLDGRTDLQRGITELASIDVAEFGKLNSVYSQQNNFVLKRDLDEDFNTDSYRSSITWTLPKADMADVDEWTHITLASTLKLDGDKGVCRALRRIQNSLIAFQDRGISEILYNSRTQLSTKDGVPVEIGNSGKVDGKRYITNKYGCINKWSIVEGKSSLYFIDSINKAFCAFNGDSVNNLSSKLGFSSWFRSNNSLISWTPDSDSIISFYDKVHSDVYLIKNEDSEQPCLVYNEMLGAFTSFYSYGNVPMMVNVEDKFISFKNNKLWLQNEGLYCNFFGFQDEFWIQYRVTPNPFTDKIWTNIEYRADFYKVLDDDGNSILGNDMDLTDIDEILYESNVTFDSLRVWNEYQTTGDSKIKPEKKFRIWRYVIPRAVATNSNIFGLDRIRSPWVNMLVRKRYDDDGKANQDLMQLHDITVKYFE